MIRPLAAALCAASLLLSLPSHGAERSIAGLRLIGEQRIALRQDFQGTAIGGLSGVDYDAVSGDCTVNGFSGEKLSVQVHGPGNLNFNGRFKKVDAGLHGSGDLTLNTGASDVVTLAPARQRGPDAQYRSQRR
eukprot:gene29425-33229_t